MESMEVINEISNTDLERIELTKMDHYKFIILFTATFGLYGLWWIYKSWQFFKDEEKTDFMPAIRALLSIFFLTPLFYKILKLAKSKGYHPSYSPVLLFLGYLIFNLSAQLPEPYFAITLFSIIWLIPPFKALNYAMDYSDQFNITIQDQFNGRQIFLLSLGGVVWILVLIGLFMK